MAEKTIEGYLRDEVKKLGGVAYKFVSPGNTGVPDRLICLPEERISFVETKDLGKQSTPKQKQQQARLRKRGFTVYAEIDSKAKVDALLQEMMR